MPTLQHIINPKYRQLIESSTTQIWSLTSPQAHSLSNTEDTNNGTIQEAWKHINNAYHKTKHVQTQFPQQQWAQMTIKCLTIWHWQSLQQNRAAISKNRNNQFIPTKNCLRWSWEKWIWSNNWSANNWINERSEANDNYILEFCKLILI